jgi:hypothetical protein
MVNLLGFLVIFLSIAISVKAQTFSEMKSSVENEDGGGWTVIWSKSYGVDRIAQLAAITYVSGPGGALEYLGNELEQLIAHMGQQVGKKVVEDALKNRGRIFLGPRNLQVKAGDAYWSETVSVPVSFNMGCKKCDCTQYRERRVASGVCTCEHGATRHGNVQRGKITVNRYIRLYVKYRSNSHSKLDGLYAIEVQTPGGWEYLHVAHNQTNGNVAVFANQHGPNARWKLVKVQ